MTDEGNQHYVAILYAFVAIFLWSLSASIARFLRNDANYVGFTIGIMTCGAVVLGAWTWYDRGSWRGELQETMADSPDVVRRFVLSLTGFGVFLMLYDLTFLYAIQEGPSVPANIINYMWPIFFPALGALVFRRTDATFGWFEAGGLSLAFGGTALIAGSSLNIFAGGFRYTFVIAFVAALSAGIYLNFLTIAQNHVDSTPLIYFVGVVVALPLTLVSVAIFDLEVVITVRSLPYVVGYGFITFAFGQVAWGKAISLGEDALISSLAYLTPVLSTLFLNLLVGAPITERVAFAAVLIVVAQVLLNDTFRHFSSVSGAAIAVLITTLIVYVDPNLFENAVFYQTIDDVVATIFAILTGFMLNRVWQVNQKENEDLTQINFALNRIVSLLEAEDDAIPADAHEESRDAIYRLMMAIIDLNYAKQSRRVGSLVRRVNEDVDDCETTLQATLDGTDSRAALDGHYRDLRQHVTDWLMLNQERVSREEITILALLGVTTILLFVVNTDGQFLPNLITIALSGVIVFTVLKVRDYNYNRTGATSKVLLEQQIMDRIDKPLYFPKEEFAFDPGLATVSDSEQMVWFGEDITTADIEEAKTVDELQIQQYVRYGVFGFVLMAIFTVLTLLYFQNSGATIAL